MLLLTLRMKTLLMHLQGVRKMLGNTSRLNYSYKNEEKHSYKYVQKWLVFEFNWKITFNENTLLSNTVSSTDTIHYNPRLQCNNCWVRIVYQVTFHKKYWKCSHLNQSEQGQVWSCTDVLLQKFQNVWETFDNIKIKVTKLFLIFIWRWIQQGF